MASNITIQNITEIPQPAYINERRVILQGYEVRDVSEDVAKAFLSQRPRQVQVYQPVVIPVRHGEAVMWLANVTGNPFLDKKLVRYKLNTKTGQEESYEIPNPLVYPMMVSREMFVDDEISQAPQGNFKESFAHPKMQVKIPPYTRYPFPISIGEWMLRRDSQMDENSVGKIAVCRPPSEFEPNDSWSHGEILVFAQMVDPQYRWANVFKIGGKKPEEQEAAKTELLHALFFRICDENYALPPEDAFNAELSRIKEEMKREKFEKEKSGQAQPAV